MNNFEQLKLDFTIHYNGNIKEFIKKFMVNSEGQFLSNSFSTISSYEKYNLQELKDIIINSSTIYSDKIRPHVFCIISDIKFPRCAVCNEKLSGKHYRSDNGGRMMLFCGKTCRVSDKGKKIHHNKTKQGTLRNHGVENIMLDKEWVSSTYLEKTKHINWDERNKKSIQTNLKNRGVEYPTQDSKVMANIRKTNNIRYGVDYVTHRTDIVSDKHLKNAWYRSLDRPWNDNEQLIHLYVSLEMSSVQIAEIYGLHYTTITKRLVELGIDIRGYAPHSISKGELEIKEYIQSIYNGKIESNFKYWKYHNNGNSKWDLDIYLPELNIGIEHDGIYWHSTFRLEEKKAKVHQLRKHLIKGEFNTDLNMINIFEDEWIHNKDRIKKYLKSLICVNSKEILYARKLSIKLVDRKQANDFYNLHHLQSAPINSTLFHYGLYQQERLISIMSFKKSNVENVELTRYCTIAQVTGGFNKLLKHSKVYLIENYSFSNIISFLDICKFNPTDNIYIRSGFVVLDIVKPDYHVVIRDIRRHKFNFRKDRLIKMCTDKGIELCHNETEFQLHRLLKINRIYDVGKIKYIMSIN